MKELKSDVDAIAYLCSKNERIVANCNTSELKKYKKDLKDTILNGEKKFVCLKEEPYFKWTHEDFFTVNSIECGLGKSYTAEMAVINRHTSYHSKGTLVFVKSKDDGKKIAKRINNAFKEDIAFALNSDTVNRDLDIEQKLQKYPIIIATHSQYQNLAKNESLRKKFMKDRTLLIIDEFIPLCEKISLSVENINTLQALFSDKYSLELFNEITSELKSYLLRIDEKRHFFNAKTDIKEIKKKCNKLKLFIKENFEDEFLKRNGSSKKKLCHDIDNILHFYNGTCLVQGYVLYTVDRTIEYWKLANNIILDASAPLNPCYALNSQLFHVPDYASVLDYCNWEVIFVCENSTSSGKDRCSNFDEIVEKIADNLGKKNTLIVDNMEKGSKKYFGYNSSYFAILRSNNHYENMKNVIIACTHYLPDIDVVLQYLYYSEKTYYDIEECEDKFNEDIANWNGRYNGYIYELENSNFENYRKMLVANEIYQAVKRVNRDMTQETTAVIITKDRKIFEMVTSMLPKCKIKYDSKYNEEQYRFKYKKNNRDSTSKEVKKETYADKIIELFRKIKAGNIPNAIIFKDKNGNIVPNKFKKSAIGTYIGIDYTKSSGRTILSNKVLKNVNVLQFMEANNITSKGQYFIF